MEKRNYKVCRDNIYVGSVVLIEDIDHYEKDLLCELSDLKVSVCMYKRYRNMLFVPDEEKKANDLLYQSPNYPILGITDAEKVLSLTGSNIVVKDACSLAPLLKYFNYGEELVYGDLLKIRELFFTGRFAKDHCELFGYKEHYPEGYRYYDENSRLVTDPIILEARMEEKRRLQLAGSRSFGGNGLGPLSHDYFDVLDQTNKTLCEYREGVYIDSFRPPKEEGPIKKLIL